MNYTADFETATWLEDSSYVWAWAVSEIGNEDNIKIGNTIDSFMQFVENNKNSKYYFHNLAFDGTFLLDYLFKHGFEFIEDKQDKKDKTFTTLISDLGMFYTIEVYFKVKNKSVKKATFIDSLKIIPFSVSGIAKAFGLPISKLELDYNKPRELGHILEPEEIEYIKNDVKIVSMALKVLFDEGLNHITSASNALHDYKKGYKEDKFSKLFPTIPLEIDKDIRQAYKGGFTYLNPIYKEVDVGEGEVLDVNSLYPSVMRYELLPVGYPIPYDGKYEDDPDYPLYIQMITCSLEVKDNMIPTIQIKGSYFLSNEYLKSSDGDIVCLVLSNVDLKLFLEHYNVYELEYIRGYKFKGMHGLFDNYIDKWTERKIKATKEGNKGQRALSKLMLNSLYGKFATSKEIQSKLPYYDELDELIKYQLSDIELVDGLYLPIGIFITAYARNKTIRTSQAIKSYSIDKYGKDMYCYSDTDSVHTLLPIDELTKFCEIDDVKLGAWKHESHFTKARFIRQKCYLEDIREKMSFKKIKCLKHKHKNRLVYLKNKRFIYQVVVKITCAGMPQSCYKYVDWEKFKTGFTCPGKLIFKRVKGGVKLIETEFTIKGDKRLLKNIKTF